MRRHNHKLSCNGQPLTWVGVNFWSKSGGPLMWRSYDPRLVREELDLMKAHGMTLTRSFFSLMRGVSSAITSSATVRTFTGSRFTSPCCSSLATTPRSVTGTK